MDLEGNIGERAEAYALISLKKKKDNNNKTNYFIKPQMHVAAHRNRMIR